MNIGNNIKTLRVSKQLSQKELASLAGITQTYLSLVENNNKKPSLSLMERIAIILEAPLALLFSEISFTGK